MRDLRALLRFAIPALLACLTAAPTWTSAAPAASECRTSCPASANRWVATWACSPQPAVKGDLPAEGVADTTIRQLVRVSRGGRQLRLRLSNSFGSTPLRISGATIALSRGEARVDPASVRPLTFSGSPAVAIAPGAIAVSDPLPFDLSPLTSVAITLHLPETPESATVHQGSRTTSYFARGNQVGAPDLPEAQKIDHWYFIQGIDVPGEATGGTVVVLGDSIADGRGSTTNANNRWPDRLAERLQQTLPAVAVANQGIGGNRLLRDGLGPNALSRLDRDVFAQPGATWLIVSEGINDLGGRVGARRAGQPFASAADILAAYDQIIARAQGQGVRVYGATLLPFGGSQYDEPDVEADRVAINQWIRTSGRFDGVVDFDAALRDPQQPTRLSPEYDSGDHLHPSPAGFVRMAAAVPLKLFGGQAPDEGGEPETPRMR